MRFQFVLRHAGALRMFDSTLRALAAAGHDVELVFNLGGDRVGRELTSLLVSDFPAVKHEVAPTPHGANALLVNFCVAAIDWMRYSDPRYRDAPKLAKRATERLRKAGPALIFVLRAMKAVLGWRRSIQLLQWLLARLPLDQQILEFLRSRPADVMVISPLVDFGSEQVEYMRAAARLGRRTALLVHSWDNLTNKGLIRVVPELVMVWNQAQEREAVDMHGVPRERIAITGAQCYDVWYDMTPTESRTQFCSRVGLDPARPYVLYTGSSSFIGADLEPQLVAELRAALQASTDGSSRDMQILVRPHPQNAKPWQKAESGATAVFPRGGALPVESAARHDYFHSLYHAAAIVGVNTSAMIEASILGRPVLTVLDQRFRETQEGTLHFHHLLSGGHLIAAPDMPALADLLGRAAAGTLHHDEGTQRFLATFVRPHGPKEAGTPRVVRSLLDLAAGPAPEPKRAGLADAAVAALALPLLPIAHLAGKAAGRKAKLRNRKTRDDQRSPGAEAILDADGWGRIIKSTETNSLEALRERFLGKKVLIGPWLSEVGFEVLYWIPYLRWLAAQSVYHPRQAVLLTRGGAQVWYPGLYGQSIDIFSLLGLDEFRRKNADRMTEMGTQKHAELGKLDEELLRLARERLGQDFEVLHPGEMYRYLQPLFGGGDGGRAPMELGRRVLVHSKLPMPASTLPEGRLPLDYVAVKFYFRSSFPATPQNKAFAAKVVRWLASRHNVVLLNTRMEFDDHEEWDAGESARIFRIDDLLRPDDNLAVQTEVIARSRAFFGTYGGLSYVPLLYGVPAFTFRSSKEGLNWTHLHLANEMALESGSSLHLFDTTEFEQMLELMGTP